MVCCLLLQNPTLAYIQTMATFQLLSEMHIIIIYAISTYSDLNVCTCVSMSAACLKTLEHVIMYVHDFSNREDGDCCLFMIMQYPCPSEEAGQILSTPMMKTHTPPTLWNYIKHAIWQNQICIMGFFPWGWGYGEERTEECNQGTSITINNLNNIRLKSEKMIFSKCTNRKFFPTHISLSLTQTLLIAVASISSWLRDMIY